MRRGDEGYSLIELLVVLALLALMAVAMSGGVRFGARVWERTEEQVLAGEQVAGAQAVLRRAIGGAIPRETGQFAGDASRMRFAGAVPAHSSAVGTAAIEIFTTPSPKGEALRIVWRPERGGRALAHTLHSARRISFAYAEAVEGRLVWRGFWQGKKPPALVRIRAEGGVSWPELIVRPRIDKDWDCSFDPVSFGCRRGGE